MTRLKIAIGTMVLAAFTLGAARADGPDAKEVIDKAIKALGGEEKLAKIQSFSVKSKGTVTFGGNENDVNVTQVATGLDHYRRESKSDQFQIVWVIAGDKGWMKFNDEPREIEGDGLAAQKRNTYLFVVPITLAAVKGKGFQCASAGEQKVGDKPAIGVKITGPDGKDFRLYFDKESGLPVKLTATVAGFQGNEVERGSDVRRLQGVRRHQEGHQGRDQARRSAVPGPHGHRVQGARQGRARHVHRAQVTRPPRRMLQFREGESPCEPACHGARTEPRLPKS